MQVNEKTIAEIIERAAERSADRVAEKLGLNDKDAPEDLRDLRGMLAAWRDMKTTARRTAVRILTTLLIGGFLLFVGIKSKILGLG